MKTINKKSAPDPAQAQKRETAQLKVKVTDMEMSELTRKLIDMARSRFGRIPEKFEGFCTPRKEGGQLSYNYEKGFKFIKENGLVTPQGELDVEAVSAFLDGIKLVGRKVDNRIFASKGIN
ncbi:Uncharacterised protein [Candidatus Gugararchaeum adminiculabundum]|nr:Uncharacterised protein [Candidatus Gugararchaeum adminiculabundum]